MEIILSNRLRLFFTNTISLRLEIIQKLQIRTDPHLKCSHLKTEGLLYFQCFVFVLFYSDAVFISKAVERFGISYLKLVDFLRLSSFWDPAEGRAHYRSIGAKVLHSTTMRKTSGYERNVCGFVG